jgi:hypothetical protein
MDIGLASIVGRLQALLLDTSNIAYYHKETVSHLHRDRLLDVEMLTHFKHGTYSVHMPSILKD